MKNKQNGVGVGVMAFLVGLSTSSTWAAVTKKEVLGRLPTRLSAAELAREELDTKRYPAFSQFLKTVDVTNGINPTDPRNKKWIKSASYFTPNVQMWNGFFKAAAADKLTCLRAFSLLAREVKKNGVVVFGPGGIFERAVEENHIDLGLAIPAQKIGAAIWSPDPTQTDPEFLSHIKIFYSES